MTLKYDLLTLKMSPSGVENVTIELAVLKTLHLDPENMFLALLEVDLGQDLSYLSDPEVVTFQSLFEGVFASDP